MEPDRFDLATFIRESNLIDPQPALSGRIIPGHKPGDPLFDNQKRAFELAQDFATQPEPPPSLALYLHRELTRGVDYYETRGMSGMYRNCDVWIGYNKAPTPYLVPTLMNEVWLPVTCELLRKVRQQEYTPLEGAWECHHCFEVIHPFIDGNGRTGRLLLNWFLLCVNAEPIVIYEKDRYDYYRSIQYWRENEWQQCCQKRGCTEWTTN